MRIHRVFSVCSASSVSVSVARFAAAALLIGVPSPRRLFASEAPSPLLVAAGLRGKATIAGDTPLILAPAQGNWDLSRHDSLFFTVSNPGRERVTVWARAENPGARGVTDNARNALVLEPGARGELRLRLIRRPKDPGYAPFKPFFMYFKNLNVRDNTLDPAAVARVVVWLEGDADEVTVVLETVAARGGGDAGPAPFLPFVDRYGQYKHADWPDKIHSDADFEAVKKKDAADMAANPGPADWDKWGGWKNGPRRKATGYFRAEKVDGKWWLVTPDGTLFWSYGPTGVSAGGEGSPVTDKETWFDELPAADGPAAKYWGRGRGARYMYYETGKEWRSFSFSGLNAERKYGPDWREVTAEGLHARLRNWGMNTMANWSDPVVYLKRKTPYVVAVGSGPLRLDHFPDVFDPAFERAVNEAMDRQKSTTAGDPWNLGYFVDNELTWGAGRGAMRAAEGALKASAESGTKKAFVGHLKTRHRELPALNRAWGTKHASWNALLEERAARAADGGVQGGLRGLRPEDGREILLHRPRSREARGAEQPLSRLPFPWAHRSFRRRDRREILRCDRLQHLRAPLGPSEPVSRRGGRALYRRRVRRDERPRSNSVARAGDDAGSGRATSRHGALARRSFRAPRARGSAFFPVSRSAPHRPGGRRSDAAGVSQRGRHAAF